MTVYYCDSLDFSGTGNDGETVVTDRSDAKLFVTTAVDEDNGLGQYLYGTASTAAATVAVKHHK